MDKFHAAVRRTSIHAEGIPNPGFFIFVEVGFKPCKFARIWRSRFNSFKVAEEGENPGNMLTQ
jgi:hypothetical protein